MTLQELVGRWEDESHGTITNDTYNVHLSMDDAARIDALAEMYPKQTKEQIISELISVAIAELESSFPYVQGNKIVTRDEMGDPVYADVGPTPTFLRLTRKHLDARKRLAKD